MKKQKKGQKKPKLRRVDRSQLIMRAVDIEDLVAIDDPARAIWEFVGKLDLSRFHAGIVSEEGEAGRSAWDPRMLISVWIYAYSRGVGSAREISRRMEYEPAFQWLCGMEKVNAHTLSDYRVRHGEALRELFTQVLAVLSSEGVLQLERVSHDGTKIQANASGKRFRGQKKMKVHLQIARAQLREVEEQERSPEAEPTRERKRRHHERQVANLERALKELQEIEEEDKKTKSRRKKERQVSETDPESRFMQHADGAVRPSYNVQVSVDWPHNFVADVEVTNRPTDQNQLIPAIERLKESFGKTPKQILADGGYSSHPTIARLAEEQIDAYLPATNKPLPCRKDRQSPYGRHRFIYDEARDEYRCPAGVALSRHGASRRDNETTLLSYWAPVKQCRACEHVSECSPHSLTSYRGRQLRRVIEPEASRALRNKMETDEAKAIYRQRSKLSEFANLWFKSKHKLRQFHVRGLAKVQSEMLWSALAFNIQTWLNLRAGPLPA